MVLDGSCHCGALTVRFETECKPSELVVLICGCSFCVKHRPRFTSDTSGRATLQVKDELLGRYRFGLRLADFLVCRSCGVFIGAYRENRAILNLDTFVRASDFTAKPTLFSKYNAEDATTRLARWASVWTPATLALA